MMLPYEIYKERIIEIENQSDSTSKYYAKVLRWKNNPRDRYHYGIGLSNLKICSLEEDFLIIDYSQVDAIIDPYLDPLFIDIEIIERLKFTLRCLRDCEEFSFNAQNLNDEHLANLIITDLAKAQPKNNILPRNLTAEKIFRDYLDNEAPDLKKEKKLAFALKASRGSTWTYVFCFILPIIGAFLLAGIEDQSSRLIIASICGILGILIARLMLRIYSLNWSGFYDKRLWDWLDLLIVPLFLASGAFYLEGRADSRNEKNLDQSRERQIILNYIKEINNLITEKEPASGSPIISTYKQPIAEAMTINLLDEINSKRKSKMLKFLADSSLVHCEERFDSKCTPVIHLEEANLRETNLKNLDLPNANLQRANLSNATLENMKLKNAKLRYANLSAATLVNVDLLDADLRNVNLSGADLSETINLREAKLKNACYIAKNTYLTKKTNFPDDFTTEDIKQKGLKKITKNQDC